MAVGGNGKTDGENADSRKGKSEEALKAVEADELSELSDEDRALKLNLDLMVTRIRDSDPGVQVCSSNRVAVLVWAAVTGIPQSALSDFVQQALALQSISNEIRCATTSMTSVPKPLKFLRAHYDQLKAAFEEMAPGQNRQKLADIVSVLAMTCGREGAKESLKYRLAGAEEDVGTWGHEYVRCGSVRLSSGALLWLTLKGQGQDHSFALFVYAETWQERSARSLLSGKRLRVALMT
jgi:26S proteasome regulatory subunit N1